MTPEDQERLKAPDERIPSETDPQKFDELAKELNQLLDAWQPDGRESLRQPTRKHPKTG